MTSSSVRVAEASDEAALGAVWESARQLLSEARGGSALMSADPAGSRPSPVMTWVVGDADLEGTVTAWIEGEVGWLALWVAPEVRSQGRGRQLAEVALAWLTEEGVAQFDALALPGDRATKQLFEALGFKARLLVMRREDVEN